MSAVRRATEDVDGPLPVSGGNVVDGAPPAVLSRLCERRFRLDRESECLDSPQKAVTGSDREARQRPTKRMAPSTAADAGLDTLLRRKAARHAK